MDKKLAVLVEKFQCPGCVCGSDTKCGSYKPETIDNAGWCDAHVLGTSMFGAGPVALGLPKGFCRPGSYFERATGNEDHQNKIRIRLWPKREHRVAHPPWNHFNVAVWAYVEDGFLFVRTYLPRLNIGYVDVVEGGTYEHVPNAQVVDPNKMD